MENYDIEVINIDGVLSIGITFTGTTICKVKEDSEKMSKEQIEATCKNFIDQARKSINIIK